MEAIVEYYHLHGNIIECEDKEKLLDLLVKDIKAMEEDEKDRVLIDILGYFEPSDMIIHPECQQCFDSDTTTIYIIGEDDEV